MVLTQRNKRIQKLEEDDLVSIPLWFLRNIIAGLGEAKAGTFPYHYGSYATQSKLILVYYQSLVSIPLWFI